MLARECPKVVALRRTFPVREMTILERTLFCAMVLFFSAWLYLGQEPPSAPARLHSNAERKLDYLEEFREFLQAPVLIPLFPTAEEDTDLHLVTFSEEFLRFTGADLEVVLAGAYRDTDVLQLLGFLQESLFLFLFLLLVAKLVEFDGFRDRRGSIRGDLDEVEPLFFGDAERFIALQNAEVLPLLIDDPELRGDYLVVDSVMDAIILPYVSRNATAERGIL